MWLPETWAQLRHLKQAQLDCRDSWRYDKMSDSGRSANHNGNPKYDVDFVELTDCRQHVEFSSRYDVSANTLNCFKNRLDK